MSGRVELLEHGGLVESLQIAAAERTNNEESQMRMAGFDYVSVWCQSNQTCSPGNQAATWRARAYVTSSSGSPSCGEGVDVEV
jgi:hypothetical protein